MSATIEQRVYFRERQPSGINSATWPAYRMDSNLRLLGRTQQNDSFSILEPTPLPCINQYDGIVKCSKIQNSQERKPHSPSPYFENRIYDSLLNIDDKDGSNNKDLVSKESPNERCANDDYYNQTKSNGNFDIASWNEDNPALRAFYTTSTQRLYEGADWPSRIVPSPAPPKTAQEKHPDTVSFRYESKRYEPSSEGWQKFGCRPFSWDYAQTRNGHHISGPVRFCSPSKKIVHIPGYMGHTSGGPGEMDNPSSNYVSVNRLRTLQPRHWETARKGNIPGYTGCVFYAEYRPACANDPEHLRSTISRSYRQHNEINCNVKSPFKKAAPMSGMVTLTHPFNPFNKVH